MSKPRRNLRHSVPSLRSLMLFESSARHLNFSKAAEENSITQSAVSHAVKLLEETLGHALFLRENRALILTSQGTRLYNAVSSGFAAISETVDDMSATGAADSVVVSCSTILAVEWLLPRMPSLRAAHPNLMVETRCLDRDPDLLSNGFDVQLRLGDGLWPGYEAKQLFAEEIVALASRDYLDRNPPITCLEDLLDHRLVLYVDPHRFRIGWAEWLRAMGVDVSKRLRIAAQVNDSLVSLKSAEAGEGLVLGQHPLVDRALAEGRLVKVLPKGLVTGLHHHLLTVKSDRQRRVVRQFCDWLVDQCGQVKA